MYSTQEGLFEDPARDLRVVLLFDCCDRREHPVGLRREPNVRGLERLAHEKNPGADERFRKRAGNRPSVIPGTTASWGAAAERGGLSRIALRPALSARTARALCLATRERHALVPSGYLEKMPAGVCWLRRAGRREGCGERSTLDDFDRRTL